LTEKENLRMTCFRNRRERVCVCDGLGYMANSDKSIYRETSLQPIEYRDDSRKGILLAASGVGTTRTPEGKSHRRRTRLRSGSHHR